MGGGLSMVREVGALRGGARSGNLCVIASRIMLATSLADIPVLGGPAR
jgi:hypothetical protein